MDASALSNSITAIRSSIRNLESTSNSLESWLYFFVTLVVIGVVLEVGFVVWEHRDDLGEYHRGIICSPQRPSGWKLLVELLGAGLVAIGVAGELGVDIKSGTVQTDLRTKNGELIQLLEGVAGNALNHAVEVEKANKQLVIDLELEKQRTASANTRLAAGQVKIQEAQRDTAKAQADAMDLQRKVNGSFLHRLLDRHVDVRLRDTLKTLPPARAGVSCLDSDTEVVIFAYEIRDALIESGWSVSPIVLLKKTPEVVSGVTIVNKSVGVFIPFTGEINPKHCCGYAQRRK